MAMRREVVAFGVFATCAILYLLLSAASGITGLSTSGEELESSSKHMASSAASTDDLVISLAAGESKTANTIKVTVENTNQHRPWTFLKWDSPFDPVSLNSGVFKLVDAETGERLQSPDLRLNRMTPPSRDDLVEVAPRWSISEELELKAPWIPTHGKKLKIEAQGTWRAAWSKRKEAVSDSELHAMAGHDVFTGQFKSSDTLELQLPGQ